VQLWSRESSATLRSQHAVASDARVASETTQASLRECIATLHTQARETKRAARRDDGKGSFAQREDKLRMRMEQLHKRRIAKTDSADGKALLLQAWPPTHTSPWLESTCLPPVE
jgi:hypothetical protein